MVFCFLILPLLLIGLLLYLSDTKISLKLISYKRYPSLLVVLSTFCTVLFMVMNIKNQENLNYDFVVNFVHPTFSISMLLAFIFVLGATFVITNKPVNHKEFALIIVHFALAMGIATADNFIHLLIYWGLSGIVATLVIFYGNDALNETTDKKRIALKYFTMQAISTLFLTMGVVDYIRIFDDILLPTNLNINDLANSFILVGVLINLAVVPFSSWLVQGHSKCSPTASIFIPLFTLIPALFIFMKFFYGNLLLVYVGIFIAAYSLLFSIFASNIRSIIIYYLIHQVGIIIMGISAAREFSGLIISHIMVTSLCALALFIVTAVLTKALNTNNLCGMLAGSVKKKSFLSVILLLISLQALAFPFTGGYISYTYIMDQISLLAASWLNYTMLILMSGTALSIGIRIPFFLIFFKNPYASDNKVTLLNAHHGIILLLIFISLEALLLTHLDGYLQITDLLNAGRIVLIGILLFAIIGYALGAKAEKITAGAESLVNKIQGLTVCLLKAIFNTSFACKCPFAKSRDHNTDNNHKSRFCCVGSGTKVEKRYHTRYATLYILIMFIVLYIAFRIF